MKEVLSNIRRTPFQSISVFLLQFFGAFLLLVSLASTSLMVSIFNRVEVQIPVIVYFKPNTAEGEIFRIRQALMQSSKVGNIDYIDKQKAFDFYKNQNQNNPLLLEMTSADDFPPSLHIQAKEPEYLNEIATYLTSEKGVDEVQFEKETVEKLIMITNVIRIAVLILASYLAVMTFITLITMVMFKIALRKEEIEINQLLGSTSLHIAKPFFDEGNFISILSTAVACGLFGALIFIVRDSFNNYLTGIGKLTLTIERFTIQTWPIQISSIAILFGIVLVYMLFISILATQVATKKYIK